MGLSKPEAAALILAAKTELQLGDGYLAVCVHSHIKVEGVPPHTETRRQCLIRTTASSAEGHRKEFRTQHSVADFRQLHEQLVPQLSPRLPDFPLPERRRHSFRRRLFKTSAEPDHDMQALDGYLRQSWPGGRRAASRS